MLWSIFLHALWPFIILRSTDLVFALLFTWRLAELCMPLKTYSEFKMFFISKITFFSRLWLSSILIFLHLRHGFLRANNLRRRFVVMILWRTSILRIFSFSEKLMQEYLFFQNVKHIFSLIGCIIFGFMSACRTNLPQYLNIQQ